MVTSDFRPEVKIWPSRSCAMHPAIIIGTVRSLIVDVAMGQIPRSTERISSLHYFCLIDNVVENRQKQPISEVQFKAEL